MAVAKAIATGIDGCIYLKNRQWLERSGKPLSKKAVEYSKKNFAKSLVNEHWGKNYKDLVGMKILMDGAFGGCKGNPENGWEEHRWTSWSADDMSRMLDEAGIEWKKAPCQEYCTI